MKGKPKDPFLIPIVCAFIALVLVVGMSVYFYKVYYKPIPIRTDTIQTE